MMPNRMKNRVIIWLLLALCVAGVVVFWIFTRTAPPAVSKEKAAPSKAMASAPSASVEKAMPGPSPKTAEKAAPPAQWEIQINDALSSSINEDQTAQVLINMLPTMPDEGKVEAAQHIANLLSDEKYQSVMPILVNPSMPEGVHEALFTDLMNRDDTVKLRAFEEIAKVPNHHMHDEALSDLQIFLDNDYGSDWARWDVAIKEYLDKQKQEEGTVPQFSR
jgi:hypothetical protein